MLLDGAALSSWCVYPLPLASLDGSSLPAAAPSSFVVASSVTYGTVASTRAAKWRPDEQWDSAAREHLHASAPSGLPAVQAALEERHAAGERPLRGNRRSSRSVEGPCCCSQMQRSISAIDRASGLRRLIADQER